MSLNIKFGMTIFMFLIALPIVFAGTATVGPSSITQEAPSNGAVFTDPSSITFRSHITLGTLACNWYQYRMYWEPLDSSWIDYYYMQRNVPYDQDWSESWSNPPVPFSGRWWVYTRESTEGGACDGDSDVSGNWNFYTQGTPLPTAPHIDFTSPAGTLSSPKTKVNLTCSGKCPDPNDCDYYIQFPTGTTVASGSISSCSGTNCWTRKKEVSVSPGNTYSWRCRVWDSYDQADSETETFTNPAVGCTNVLSYVTLSNPSNGYTFSSGTTSVSHNYQVGFTGNTYQMQTRIYGRKNGGGSYTTEATTPAQDFDVMFSPVSFSGAGYQCGGIAMTDGSYCDWYVSAWDNCTTYPGIVSSTWRYYVASAPSCPNPKVSLTNPTDSSTWPSSTSYVAMNWRINVSVNGPVTSKIYVKIDGGSFVLNKTQTNSLVAPYGLLQYEYNVTPGHTYQWYVRANDSCGNVQTSSTRTFYVQPAIACSNVTVTQLSPYNGEIKSYLLPNTTLQWRVNVSIKANVTTRIYKSFNGGAFTLFYEDLKTEYSPPAGYHQTIIPLVAGSTYQWYVRVNDSCNAYVSPTRSFSVQATPTLPVVTLLNPTNGQSFPESTASILFRWTVSSGTGNPTIDRLFINGILRYTSPSHAPGTYTYSWTGFTKGMSYTAYVNTTDAIGSTLSNTNSFSVACTPSWVKTTKPCQPNNKMLVIYIDEKGCYGATPPVGNGTYENCTYCQTDFYCDGYEQCTGQTVQECNNVKDRNNCCLIDSSFCASTPSASVFDRDCNYADEVRFNSVLVDTENVNNGFLPELYRGLRSFISPWFFPFIILMVVIMFALVMFMVYKRVSEQ